MDTLLNFEKMQELNHDLEIWSSVALIVLLIILKIADGKTLDKKDSNRTDPS